MTTVDYLIALYYVELVIAGFGVLWKRTGSGYD